MFTKSLHLICIRGYQVKKIQVIFWAGKASGSEYGFGRQQSSYGMPSIKRTFRNKILLCWNEEIVGFMF